MHTFGTIYYDLQKASIDTHKPLMVHSSMKAIGQVSGGADTVIDALMAYMRDGLLLLPTHSWSDSSLQGGVYDPKIEPACVGIIPNLFMKRPNVYRSIHPTHSVAAYGNRAQSYVSFDDYILNEQKATPCDWRGCFGRLYSEDANILFLGAPLTTNTFLHGVEEYIGIDNRINNKYRIIKIKTDNNTDIEVKVYGHHSTGGDVSQNFDKIKDALLYKNYMHYAKIGDADCYVLKARETADVVMHLLKKDKDLFLDKREVPKSWYME